MEYDLKEIGRIIREERKKLGQGWSQDKLGSRLGVTGKQVSNYESGKLIPPQETLLKMAEIFGCEYGYLLGEENYKDGSKLMTAICKSLCLSRDAVQALQKATHKGVPEELAERRCAISCFFEAADFGCFMDCLVEAVTISRELSAHSDLAYQELAGRYGEEIASKAVLYCLSGDAVSAEYESNPKFREAVMDLNSSIDKSRSQEYALKVARYELREAFEQLIRSIQ